MEIVLLPNGNRPASSRRHIIAILALLALAQILCLRPGHIWGDDFAHYILQAKHLVALQGYAAREYLPNPDVLNLAPQTVPPGLSLLLAPLYAIFGLNLTVMKIALVLVFIAGLYCLDSLFSDRLPRSWRYVLIIVVALNPVIFRMRDEIETEKLFVPLMLLSLCLMKQSYDEHNRWHSQTELAMATGLSIFAAAITRNVGFALFPLLPVLDLLRFRRIRRYTLLSLTGAAFPTMALSLLTRSTSGYAHLFNFSPLWISHSAFVFATTFEKFWWGINPRWVGYAVLVLVACLAIRGASLVIFRNRDVGPIEVFIVCYLCIVLPYFLPGYEFYLVPLFPFLIGYMLLGLYDLCNHTRYYRQIAFTAGVCAAVLFGVVQAKAGWGRIPDGIGDPQFRAVCGFIERETSASEVVVFRKPRLLALLTGHRSTVYPMHLDRPPEPSEILAYIESVHVGYVIVARISDPEFEYDAIVEQTLTRNASIAHPVYSNAHFVVYKVDSGDRLPES